MNDWLEQAACRDHPDPAIFFPTEAGTPNAAPAKAVCAGCPVKNECLDYALTNHERHGVWGGLAEYERRKHRRLLEVYSDVHRGVA